MKLTKNKLTVQEFRNDMGFLAVKDYEQVYATAKQICDELKAPEKVSDEISFRQVVMRREELNNLKKSFARHRRAAMELENKKFVDQCKSIEHLFLQATKEYDELIDKYQIKAINDRGDTVDDTIVYLVPLDPSREAEFKELLDVKGFTYKKQGETL